MVSETNANLQDNGFWDDAFEKDALFHSHFVSEFRRGLADGSRDDLAWARLAVHAIRDCALWPIVMRLTELAARMPRAEFVESLAFFVSDENTLRRLRQGLGAIKNSELQRALGDCATLQLELKNMGDKDLSDRLDPLVNLMKVR